MGNSKSLYSQKHHFQFSQNQIDYLEKNTPVKFEEKLRKQNLFPLTPKTLEIFQINIGKMCNQVCKHCHVDAGPDRKEIMTQETMALCLKSIELSGAHTVDITGGAPEMNPNFRWFIEQVSSLGKTIIVRSNLTIIVSNPQYYTLPDFFKHHNVEVISSLPYFTAQKTDIQRGEGVFEKSIKALKMLNEVGYGRDNSPLKLHLVYNPTGAFLPANQISLEKEFKQKLKQLHNIDFHNLYTITNLPISRFLHYLIETNNYNDYMEKLINLYNPLAAENVMCRNTISISWDGYIYDCDFNQMLEMKIETESQYQHISFFNTNILSHRNIKVNQHCYGCTAGAGSSCSGNTI